jgi:hypothetical protein
MAEWNESGRGFILTTPRQISAFAMLQIHRKLAMEVKHPNGPRWYGSPMKQAKSIMANYGVECRHRTKAKVLVQYEQFLKDAGVLS